MGCFVVSTFILATASRCPSAIAELLVVVYICCFIINYSAFLALKLGRAIMHHHTEILLKEVQMISEISCFYISRWQLATVFNF